MESKSSLQLAFEEYMRRVGVDEAIRHTSKLSGILVPHPSWKHHNRLQFAIRINSNIHLKVFRARFEGLGINPETKLVYKTGVFTLMAHRLCKKNNLDFETIAGYAVHQAPRGDNYPLLLLLTIAAGLKNQHWLFDACCRTMEKKSLSKNTVIGMNQGIVVEADPFQANLRRQRLVTETLDENVESALEFEPRFHKLMQSLKDSDNAIDAVKVQAKLEEKLLQARKAIIGNKMAEEFLDDSELGNDMRKAVEKVNKMNEENDFQPLMLDQGNIIQENDELHRRTVDFIARVNSIDLPQFIKTVKACCYNAATKDMLAELLKNSLAEILQREEQNLRQLKKDIDIQERRRDTVRQLVSSSEDSSSFSGGDGNSSDSFDGDDDDEEGDLGGLNPGGKKERRGGSSNRKRSTKKRSSKGQTKRAKNRSSNDKMSRKAKRRSKQSVQENRLNFESDGGLFEEREFFPKRTKTINREFKKETSMFDEPFFRKKKPKKTSDDNREKSAKNRNLKKARSDSGTKGNGSDLEDLGRRYEKSHENSSQHSGKGEMDEERVVNDFGDEEDKETPRNLDHRGVAPSEIEVVPNQKNVEESQNPH